MDRDEVWRAIDAARRDIVALLDDLSNEEWAQPSLCAGWTVRDVAAHLTLQEIGTRRHNFGITPRDALIDALVHGQDIAIPLNRTLTMAPAAAAIAATRVWQLGYPFHVRKLHGFRLSATDIEWSAGEGAAVTGPIAALLLVLTGRLVGLEHLSGAGAEALTAR